MEEEEEKQKEEKKVTQLRKCRSIKFSLSLSRHRTGNPEKFCAKTFLACSPTPPYIFLYSDILGALFLAQFDLEKCSQRLSKKVGILNNKAFLLFISTSVYFLI